MMLAREDRSEGRSKVAAFHRKRNADSLMEYKREIGEEKGKRLAHRRAISEQEKKLRGLARAVEEKKARLGDIQG